MEVTERAADKVKEGHVTDARGGEDGSGRGGGSDLAARTAATLAAEFAIAAKVAASKASATAERAREAAIDNRVGDAVDAAHECRCAANEAAAAAAAARAASEEATALAAAATRAANIFNITAAERRAREEANKALAAATAAEKAASSASVAASNATNHADGAAAASAGDFSFLAKQPKKQLKNDKVWEHMVEYLKERKPVRAIMEFMKAHCTDGIPTKWFGAVNQQAPQIALQILLTDLDGQVWCLENKGDPSYFCQEIGTWITELELVTFSVNLPASLERVTTVDSRVVRLVLAYACRGRQDTSNAGGKQLISIDNNIRACIHANIQEYTPSTFMPFVVSHCLVSPLVVKEYPLGKNPPTPVDPFVLKLLHIGWCDEESTMYEEWHKVVHSLLTEHLMIDPAAVAKWQGIGAEALWSLLADHTKARNAHASLCRDPALFWAQHAPLDFFRNAASSNACFPGHACFPSHACVSGHTCSPIHTCIPHRTCIPSHSSTACPLRLAYRHVVDPDSLSYTQFKALNMGLVKVIKERVVAADVPINESSAGKTFDQLQGDIAEAHRLWALWRRLCDLLRFRGVIYCVREPIFNDSDALAIAREDVRLFVEQDAIVQLLAQKQGIEEKIEKIVGWQSSRLTVDLRPTFSVEEVVSAAFSALLPNIDELMIDSITQLPGFNKAWCRLQGVPLFDEWMASRDSLQRLVDFVNSNGFTTIVRASAPAAGGDDRPPAGLYALLRGSLDIKKGSEYKEFERKLGKYIKFYKNGAFRLVLDSVCNYCSKEWDVVRTVLERDVQSTKDWQVAPTKAILAAVGVLTTALPNRHKGLAREVDGSHAAGLMHIDFLLQGMSDAVQRSPDLWTILTPDVCRDLLTLLDSFSDARPSQADMDAEIQEILKHGVFECQTVEDYDTADGVARSYWLSIKSTSNRSQEVKRYNAYQLEALLSEVDAANDVRYADISKIVRTLKRVVDIGTIVLSRGFQDFVAFVRQKLEPVALLLRLSNHEINGRTTGFRFSVQVNMITEARIRDLSEMIRLVASECESFVSAIRQQSIDHPVLSCFEDKEIGNILDVMLEMNNQIAQKVRQIVVRRLGDVSVNVRALTTTNASLADRLKLLAETLTELCTVMPRTDLKVPQVWYLENTCDWPLAVANVFGHAPGGRCHVKAHQVCLPLGTSSELLVSRESFLRRVRSGVCPRGDASAVFCLVVPEATKLPSVTLDLLNELCEASPLTLHIIVSRSFVDIGRNRALFLRNATVRRADVTPVKDFFSPTANQMIVVAGPSRSGKMQLAKEQAAEHFRSPTTVAAVGCEMFLNGTTFPHQLDGLLQGVGQRHAAILEVGAAVTEHLQALIFALAVGCWSTRDGASVQRVHPVVLKVHEKLAAELPVLKLFHTATTDAMRPSAMLSTQYVQHISTLLPTLSVAAGASVEDIGGRLEAPSKLPLTAASFKALASPQNEKDFNDTMHSNELPGYLLTTVRGVPFFICLEDETSLHQTKQFSVNGAPIERKILRDMSGKDSNEVNETLWELVFDVLDTPGKREIPNLVMTPSICLFLIRLDLSVKCRLSCRDRADDGVVTFVGETGCGKTQLVSMYCKYRGWRRPEVIQVHAGTTAAAIIAAVRGLLAKWKQGRGVGNSTPMVVFFDEFNTSPAQDVIKRILLDRLVPLGDGKHAELPSTRDGWVLVAACNAC